MGRHARTAGPSSLLLVALMLVVAGCGGSSSSSSSTGPANGETDSDTGNTQVKAAQEAVAKYSATQPPLEIPMLKQKPQSGRTITIVTCPLPVCKTATDPAKKAAGQLGWKLTYLVSDLTPEAYQATLNQIVADPPELLALTPVVPNSFVSKQLNQLQSDGVKMVELAPAGDEPSTQGPILAAAAGPPQMGQSGRLMGDSVVADAGGAADTVFIWDPSLAPLWQPVKDEFSKKVEAAGGGVEELKVSQIEIGKAIPTQVVSFVQSHPDVHYLAFALNDLTTGVPQALQSAGLNESVKIVSRAPLESNLQNIQNGLEWTSVAEETSGVGYRAIDQLIRLVEGEPLPGQLRNPAGWAQILNPESTKGLNGIPLPAGFPEAFEKAWHLAG